MSDNRNLFLHLSPLQPKKAKVWRNEVYLFLWIIFFHMRFAPLAIARSEWHVLLNGKPLLKPPDYLGVFLDKKTTHIAQVVL